MIYCILQSIVYWLNVPVNSKTAHPPPGNPRAFDSRQAPYSGEFDLTWGPPGGAFDFRTKTSVSGRKQKDFQFFDSASEPRSRIIALVDSTGVFLLLSFYIVESWNMPLFKVWSEDKLNKKFVVAENLFPNVSDSVYIRLFHECMAWQGGWFDPLWSSNRWGIWPWKRQHSGEFDQNFSKKSNAPGFARGGGWVVLELTGTLPGQ